MDPISFLLCHQREKKEMGFKWTTALTHRLPVQALRLRSPLHPLRNPSAVQYYPFLGTKHPLTNLSITSFCFPNFPYS
jgi:hypothetical protein